MAIGKQDGASLSHGSEGTRHGGHRRKKNSLRVLVTRVLVETASKISVHPDRAERRVKAPP